MIGLVLVACVLFQTGSVRTASANDDADGKKMIMVSLGDSYASGEGIPPFYGWNDVQAWSFLTPRSLSSKDTSNLKPGWPTDRYTAGQEC